MAKKRNKNTGVDALSNAVGGGEDEKLKKAPSKKPSPVESKVNRVIKKPKKKKSGESPVSRAMKYLGSDDFAKEARIYNTKLEAPSAPKESIIGEEPNSEQTRLDLSSLSEQKNNTSSESVAEDSRQDDSEKKNVTEKGKTGQSTSKTAVSDNFGDPKMEFGDMLDEQQTQPTKSTYDRESEAAKKVAERVGGMNLTGVGQTPPSKGLEEEAELKDSDKKPSRFFKQEQDKNALNLTENPNEIKNKVVENIQNDPTLTQEEKLEKIQDAQQIPLEIDKEIKGNEALIEAIEGDGDVKDDVDKNLTTSDFTQSRDDLMRAFQFEDPDFLKKAQFYKQLYDRNRGRNNAEPAIEKLGLTDYFPTMNQPIAVGSYSRKTLGSGNIYAPAGFTMPMGILDARNRAIQAAAKANKKRTDGLLKGMYVKSAPQFQAQIDDMSYKAIEEYTKAVGADLRVLTDPTNPLTQQFYKDMRDMQTFGQQTIDLNTRVEELMKKATGADGERLYIPDALRDYIQKYYTGYEDAESMFRDKDWFRKFSDYVKSYDNLTHYADEWWAKAGTERGFDKVYFNPTKPPKNPEDYQKQSYQDDWAKIRSGNTDLHMSAYKKFFNVDKFRQAAKTLMANRYFSEEFTEDDITKYLMTMAGTKQGYDHINTYTGRLTYKAQGERLSKEYTTRATDLYNAVQSSVPTLDAAVADSWEGGTAESRFASAITANQLNRPSYVVRNINGKRTKIPQWNLRGNNKAITANETNSEVFYNGRYMPVEEARKKAYDKIKKNKEIMDEVGEGGEYDAATMGRLQKVTDIEVALAYNVFSGGIQGKHTGTDIRYVGENGLPYGFDEQTGAALVDKLETSTPIVENRISVNQEYQVPSVDDFGVAIGMVATPEGYTISDGFIDAEGKPVTGYEKRRFAVEFKTTANATQQSLDESDSYLTAPPKMGVVGAGMIGMEGTPPASSSGSTEETTIDVM